MLVSHGIMSSEFPSNIYLFKIGNRNTRKRCEICSWYDVVDIVDLVLMFLILTLNIFHTFSSISIVDFEQVNVSWFKSSKLTHSVSTMLSYFSIFSCNRSQTLAIATEYPLDTRRPESFESNCSKWEHNHENELILQE